MPGGKTRNGGGGASNGTGFHCRQFVRFMDLAVPSGIHEKLTKMDEHLQA